MNEKINKSLSFLENTQIKLLANSADDPVERYNTLCNLYLSDNFLKNVGLGSLSAVLLKASIPKVTITPLTGASTALATTGTSTALATTGSTALSTTLAGGSVGGAAVAGGGSVLPVIAPIIATAISGWYLGKAIGDLVLENIVYAQKFKSESEVLGKNVNTLKTYCESMNQQLSSALKNINDAVKKIDKAAEKLENTEYSTKDNNIKRMQKRKTELTTLYRDIGAVQEVLNAINQNLSKIN